jgi:hypothetical protein
MGFITALPYMYIMYFEFSSTPLMGQSINNVLERVCINSVLALGGGKIRTNSWNRFWQPH